METSRGHRAAQASCLGRVEVFRVSKETFVAPKKGPVWRQSCEHVEACQTLVPGLERYESTRLLRLDVESCQVIILGVPAPRVH
eukprot:8360172-Pyramimonas_sp.AAC.1